MRYASFDHFFTILGNKQRMRVLQFLAEEGPKSVSAIAKALGIEQSAVSHGLRLLLRCHFVTVKREGKARIYAINKDTVEPLLKQINRHVRTYCVAACDHN